MVSFLTFLIIVLLMVPINCKNFASEGLVIHPENTLHNSESPEKAQDWYTNDNQGEEKDKDIL